MFSKQEKSCSESCILKRSCAERLFWVSPWNKSMVYKWEFTTHLFLFFHIDFNTTEISHTSASAFLKRTAKIFQVTNTNKSTKIGSCGYEECLLKAHLYTCHFLTDLNFLCWLQNCDVEHNYTLSSFFFFISSKLPLICIISLCNILIELKCKF